MTYDPQGSGPAYPDLGETVRKLRHGNDRKAHGEAVHKAMRALQRAELNRTTKSATKRDQPIGDARRQMLRKKLLNYPAQIRKARTPEQWRELYEQAMMEKHAT